jgi:glycosyltransferase involved in cell wall biosynthesis
LAHGGAVHRGPLAEAVAAFRPDVVHVHGLALLEEQRAALEAAGVPVTLRGRGTDTAPEAIARALALPKLVRAYLMPGAGGPQDARLRRAAPVFDTALFAPAAEKDHRLVLRAAPALPESELRSVLELAKRLPAHRVVVAVASVGGHEDEIAALRAYREEIISPAELIVDAPRAEMARLFASAGICVHSASAAPDRRPRAGGPASLVEAMATGAYVLARRVQPYLGFLGKAGAPYDDAAEAAALIRATEAWSDAEWRDARIRAIDQAFKLHADELVLRPLFEDWCAIARERARAEADAA